MTLQRAYSLLTVKDVDESRRIVAGIASTPTPDRMGDVVEPMGAKFKTPMPLLLYHNSNLPVGTIDFASPTKDGIPFQASLPNVVEPGTIQDRVNEALHSLKYKLIGAVSIGFRAIEDGVELLKSGGLRFKSWEWLELSLVAIPAQPEAVIQTFKSMDADRVRDFLGVHASGSDEDRAELIKSLQSTQAASGHVRKGVRLDVTPGASGTTTAAHRGSVKLIPRNNR